MTERTITDATRIVIEKETKDLGSMIEHAQSVMDGNFSDTYKNISGEILSEEIERISPKGPVPED